MPLSEKALLKRDAKRNIGAEVLQAIRDIKAGKGRRVNVEASPVSVARRKVGMSQSEFAKLLGVSVRTLQDWEQGRRQPTGAARSLLAVAVRQPRMLKEILKEFAEAA